MAAGAPIQDAATARRLKTPRTLRCAAPGLLPAFKVCTALANMLRELILKLLCEIRIAPLVFLLSIMLAQYEHSRAYSYDICYDHFDKLNEAAARNCQSHSSLHRDVLPAKCRALP